MPSKNQSTCDFGPMAKRGLYLKSKQGVKFSKDTRGPLDTLCKKFIDKMIDEAQKKAEGGKVIKVKQLKDVISKEKNGDKFIKSGEKLLQLLEKQESKEKKKKKETSKKKKETSKKKKKTQKSSSPAVDETSTEPTTPTKESPSKQDTD